jgi:hypothetical protein
VANNEASYPGLFSLLAGLISSRIQFSTRENIMTTNQCCGSWYEILIVETDPDPPYYCGIFGGAAKLAKYAYTYEGCLHL